MFCFHLISTTGNESFYKKLGLKRIKIGMARYLNPNLVFRITIFLLELTGACAAELRSYHIAGGIPVE